MNAIVTAIRQQARERGLHEYDWQSVLVLALWSAGNSDREHRFRSRLDRMTKQCWYEEGASLWLSPSGMPFYVGYSGHCILYSEIFETGSTYMEGRGWIHISNAGLTGCISRQMRNAAGWTPIGRCLILRTTLSIRIGKRASPRKTTS